MPPDITNIGHISLSLSTNTLSPTRRKGSSKEVTDNNIEDSMENTLTGVPFMADTQCLIDEFSKWLTIKDVFSKKEKFMRMLRN